MPSFVRPVLLVDFDGVLNPFEAAACPPGFVEYGDDVFPGMEPVGLSQEHAEWLRNLGSDFDLVWASACPEDLNRHCSHLIGLDPMPRVPMPAPPFHPELEVPAVDAYVGDRDVAWLDDFFGEPARRWAQQRTSSTLLIDVDPAVGLTFDMVATLTDWQRTFAPKGNASLLAERSEPPA